MVPHFSGTTYKPARDYERLRAQYLRVFNLMKDGEWRTLGAIAEHTGDPTPSISARLRDMRKERFGRHCVERIYLTRGLYGYRLLVNADAPAEDA